MFWGYINLFSLSYRVSLSPIGTSCEVGTYLKTSYKTNGCEIFGFFSKSVFMPIIVSIEKTDDLGKSCLSCDWYDYEASRIDSLPSYLFQRDKINRNKELVSSRGLFYMVSISRALVSDGRWRSTFLVFIAIEVYHRG